jgi:hypothetical protein
MPSKIRGVTHLFRPGGINPHTFNTELTKKQKKALIYSHEKKYNPNKYRIRMSLKTPSKITDTDYHNDNDDNDENDTVVPLQHPNIDEQRNTEPNRNNSSLTTTHYYTPSPNPKRNKKRPPALNIGSTAFVAPNLRAAEIARTQGNTAMNEMFGDSTDPRNYNEKAPENFGDNPEYDVLHLNEWKLNEWKYPGSSLNYKGGRSKKRRYTRGRSHKYKPKCKRQTRKKTVNIKRK